MFLHGIRDVLVNAIRAGWFGVVTVNVFSQDVPKKGVRFREALSGRHDNDVIVVDEGLAIRGQLDWFHGRFPASVPRAGAVPVGDFTNPVKFVA
jgi:hypothetical protein